MDEDPQTEEDIRGIIRDMLIAAGLPPEEVNEIFGLINAICDIKTGEGE